MGINVLRKWQNILRKGNKRSGDPALVGRRSKSFRIRALGLLLAGSVWCSSALGATTTTVTLSPGTTPLVEGTSYSITTAGEYTVTTKKTYLDGTSLSVSLLGEGKEVVLILYSCRLRPSGSPALTVTGTELLTKNHTVGDD